MTKPSGLVQGTLDVLILKMVALEPMSGWGIIHRLRQTSADALQVSHGSLYPALHKLEERGLIVAEWGITEHNRRAKFYRLTTAGKKQLAASRDYWARFAGAVYKVLETAPTAR